MAKMSPSSAARWVENTRGRIEGSGGGGCCMSEREGEGLG